MRPMDLADVGCAGIAALIAEDRAPVVLVTQPRIPGNVELRKTALANVGTIGPGDAEDFQADVFTKVGAKDYLAALGDGEDAVHNEVVAECARVADGAHVASGRAAAASALTYA